MFVKEVILDVADVDIVNYNYLNSPVLLFRKLNR